MEINGDLIPTASGQAHLGVDGSVGDAFDITTLTPFGHIHMNSGVWHDPMTGQSGVLRYSQAAGAFQISIDGGRTFNDLVTGGTTVTSVGVIGGANLTGNIDLSPTTSGFIVIEDSSGSSPITFSLDVWALSGLYNLPAQGFNGAVVNHITDSNGTSAQGDVQIIGASGITTDLIGQVLTISPGPSGGFATCHVQAFAASTSWVVQHNLNTPHIIVQAFNNASPAVAIIPDKTILTSAAVVTIQFNTPQSGKAVVLACKNIF